jgi:osmoprotectant transport system permease protein
MGMTGSQVVRKVEFPNALPLVLSGTRSATLQVIATATVAAYVTLGGLGRYLVDGLSQLNDPQAGYPAMAAGAILVALLAIVADLLFAIAQRFLVPRGVSGRFRTTAKAAAPTSVAAGPMEVTVGPS